jgi:hypothetical protein
LTEGGRQNIYFWRRRDGSEVDLVIKGTNVFKAYELKWAKQTTTKLAKSFTNAYKIPVEVITKDKILYCSLRYVCLEQKSIIG